MLVVFKCVIILSCIFTSIFDQLGGECVFWELCGREEFLASYHYVLTFQQPAVHLITVSLREPLTVQLQQIKFWLQFILDRINPSNVGKGLLHFDFPLYCNLYTFVKDKLCNSDFCNCLSFIKGFGGKCNDVKVILVGTYAPEPLAPNSNGGNLLAPLLPFLKDFASILGEEPQMVALDATNPSSPGLKLLRSYLNNARMEFLEVKRLYFLYSINTYHTFIQLEEIIYFIDRFSLILANNLGFDKSSFR